MLQTRRSLDLDHEPLGIEDGGELRLEDFDGDFAVVLAIVGKKEVAPSARVSTSAANLSSRGAFS